MKLMQQEYLDDIEDNAKEVIQNILQYKFSNPELNKIEDESSGYLYINAIKFINKSNANTHKKLLDKILDLSKSRIDKIKKEKIVYYAYFQKDRKKFIPNFNPDLFIRNLILIFYEDPENKLIKELFKLREIKNKNFKIYFEKRKHLSDYLYECGDNSITSITINGILIYKDNINMFTSKDEMTVDDNSIIIFDLQDEEGWNNIHKLFGGMRE